MMRMCFFNSLEWPLLFFYQTIFWSFSLCSLLRLCLCSIIISGLDSLYDKMDGNMSLADALNGKTRAQCVILGLNWKNLNCSAKLSGIYKIWIFPPNQKLCNLLLHGDGLGNQSGYLYESFFVKTNPQL